MLFFARKCAALLLFPTFSRCLCSCDIGWLATCRWWGQPQSSLCSTPGWMRRWASLGKLLCSLDEPKDDSFWTRETEIRLQHTIQVAGNPKLPFYCVFFFFIPFWSSQCDIFSEIHLEIAFSCFLPPHIFGLPPQGRWFNNRSEGALKQAFLLIWSDFIYTGHGKSMSQFKTPPADIKDHISSPEFLTLNAPNKRSTHPLQTCTNDIRTPGTAAFPELSLFCQKCQNPEPLAWSMCGIMAWNLTKDGFSVFHPIPHIRPFIFHYIRGQYTIKYNCFNEGLSFG